MIESYPVPVEGGVSKEVQWSIPPSYFECVTQQRAAAAARRHGLAVASMQNQYSRVTQPNVGAHVPRKRGNCPGLIECLLDCTVFIEALG